MNPAEFLAHGGGAALREMPEIAGKIELLKRSLAHLKGEDGVALAQTLGRIQGQLEALDWLTARLPAELAASLTADKEIEDDGLPSAGRRTRLTRDSLRSFLTPRRVGAGRS